jgi:membrane glycosyltransferase
VALVAGTTLAAAWQMASVMGSGGDAPGIQPLELLILGLFVPTFGWIALTFWTAVAGFLLGLFRRDPLTLGQLSAGASPAQALEGWSPSSTTAIAVPIYNEDPAAVTARLSAMARSLSRLGAADAFHLHLLSDTGDPGIARAEEAAWAQLQGSHPGMVIAYRRRASNEGRKAGNLAEFLRRCADDYDFVVVLDADSLMSGETLLRMVRRMESDPGLGLLQTVPLPIRQRTVFGRLVQFAAALQAPMVAGGHAFWHGDAGNYWGHNAILRPGPFLEHARLPVLPGRAPMGGEILSHDFVEAALLRKAGWGVVMDPTLGGSWEEVPGTLVHYAVRDRRWAQGSLQHLRLLGMRGLHPLSRLHFLMGAMGFISSALWFLILAAGTVWVLVPASRGGPALLPPPGAPAPVGGPLAALPALHLPLLAITALILFGPRILAAALTLFQRRRDFGGALRLGAGVLLESLMSVLLAPVLMLYHARFVAEIAAGRAVGWAAQLREGVSLTWGEALRGGWMATAVGLAWGGATLLLSPTFFLWMSPIFAGLLLSIPLLRVTGSTGSGRRLRRLGVLSTPAELIRPVEVAEMEAELTAKADPLESPGVLPSHPIPAPARVHPGRETMYNAERALFELQRGRPVLVMDAETGNGSGPLPMLVAGVESMDRVTLRRLVDLAGTDPMLVVTGHRLAAMGLDGDVLSGGAGSETVGWTLSGDGLMADADGTTGSARIRVLASAPPAELGRWSGQVRPANPGEQAGLSLARLAGTLPSVVVLTAPGGGGDGLKAAVASGEILSVRADEVADFAAAARSHVIRVSDAPVPLPGAEASHFVLFREAFGLGEHVAIMVGDRDQWPDPVPVRLHSACFTGDLFGSLRCDCGEQLRGSMDHFRARGGGVLLYLAQEGRGIGLTNKFRAYTLQGTGLDTIDADGTLGFGADERDYDVAVGMLNELGIRHVELLTNNPEKLGALEEAGIRIARRQPLHGRLNRHNRPYVEAKVNRAGHWLRAMLAQPLAGD